jgi:eukaryotic-like serine/threonine-protein kinase
VTVQLKDLDPAEAERLTALLDEALDLPLAERGAWHARLAEHEPKLAKLTADLLSVMGMPQGAALAETRDLIARHLTRAVAQPSLEGRRFGPYRIVRLLGRGGMGSVWLAERSDGLFARQVALKLVNASVTGPSLSERFARERSILATLNHPYIARLFDAGVAEDGQQYLAIEYVEGTPLTSYCDEHRLTLQQRIDLLLQVLAAVRHAHQNLTVHRDLKPSNILVTGERRVRLLDFGIAKLLTEDAASDSELTDVGGRALTLEYASPEQVAGQPVSTASDVYSLGVLLYTLLCGQRPFQLPRQSRGALEEAILTRDPIKPSQQPVSAEIAQARGMTPKKLARALAGDLDTITLKALKKKPAERYATADAFMQDLQRYLTGMPVLTRPDGATYRLRKLVSRSKGKFAVAAAIGVVLIGTPVLLLRQAQSALEKAKTACVVQNIR